MTDIQRYTKISSLPSDLKKEVADFIDFIKNKSSAVRLKSKKRIAGQTKNLISMKDNFDDPIEDLFQLADGRCNGTTII